MRRTVTVVAVAATLLAMAGVASATPLPSAVPTQPGLPSPRPDPAGPEAPVTTPPRVGTIESVDAVLGYLESPRSVSFHYPGADYVKVHLSQLRLRVGDYVTVSDPLGQEVHRYEAEPGTSSGSAGRWAMSVTGETAVVRLHVVDPLRTSESMSGLGVRVGRVARGDAAADAAHPSARQESVCGTNDSRDAVCYRSRKPEIYRNSQAVARLLIGGMQMCTAFRVGPGNHLLTNNHCLDHAQQVRDTEVWFGYQCAECGGQLIRRPVKVRGDQLLATDAILDFTLFTVEEPERVAPFGYLRLDADPVPAGERIYVPQHPGGAPTRVALRSDRDPGRACTVSRTGVHGLGWYTDLTYFCDTQAGSSGSPVLSRRTHRVVALHHFGGCPNAGVRMDLIYPHLTDHLAPSPVLS